MFDFKCLSLKSGHQYDATSVKRLIDFLARCRQLLNNKENLFWVTVQSNLLADLCEVEKNFENAVKEMKEEMKRNGWILPTLKTNMRNQINIANVQVGKGDYYSLEMQSSIEKNKPGTSLVGELPIRFKVDYMSWYEKKYEVLKHCIELISKKSQKNIVILVEINRLDLFDQFDLKDKISPSADSFFNIAYGIKGLFQDKKVVAYPSEEESKERRKSRRKPKVRRIIKY